MIGPGTGVRVYLACGATDLRKGISGLAAKAQQSLKITYTIFRTFEIGSFF
jgi:transposase